MNLRLTLLALLTLGAAFLAGWHPAQAQDPEDLLARLEETYNAAEALRADITQTTSSPFSEATSTYEGTLLLRGNQYRVETDQQTLVTDGETTWIYNPAEGQVLVNDYVEDETAFSPSDFFYHYTDRYDVQDVRSETYRGAEHYVLELEPKDPGSFYQRFTLWMRQQDALVTRLEVTDANESTMMFELSNITLEPPVGDDAFTFTPPEGVEVVDLRS